MKKLSYQELEEKIKQLELSNCLLEKSPIIKFLWKKNGSCLVESVSANVKAVFGYSADELLSGKIHYNELIHPDDLPRVVAEMKENSQFSPYSFVHQPYRIITKSGEIKWLNDVTLIRRGENNEITHYEGLVSDITEQKELEQKLRKQNAEYAILNKKYETQNRELQIAKKNAEESNERLRSITESTIDVIFVIDKFGKIVFLSKQIEDLLGYKLEELVGKSFTRFVLKKEIPHYFFKLSDIFRNKEVRNFITYIPHKSGKLIHVEISGKLTRYNGQLAGQGMVRDISEREATKKMLLQSEEKLREAQKIAHIGFWFWDIKTGKLTWSEEEYNIFGLPVGTVITNSIFQNYVHKDDTKLLEAAYNEILKGKVYDIKFRIVVNGKIKWLHETARMQFDDNHNPLSASGITYDITKVMANEEKLKKQNEEYAALNEEYQAQNEIISKAKTQIERSEQKFKTFTNQSADGITVADLEGNYVFVNPAFCKMSGYTEAELLQMTVFDMKAPEQSYQSFYDSKIRTKGVVSRVNLIRKDGTEYFTEIIGKIISIGNSDFVFGTIRDITDKVKAEQELIIAKERAEESNRLKTEFLNNMSHEIRTPMNGILGFSEFLSTPNLSEERRRYFVQIIQNSGNQLLSIIDDILEISKLETKQVSVSEDEICLNDFLLELFSVFDIRAKENKIPLYFEKGLSDHAATLRTDKTKLHKIVSNLLENALKFTASGYVKLAYRLKDKQIQIYVEDTGIGISTDKQELIFERFSQADKELSRNFGGLGLGLSIAKENAELLGGNITLESEKGKGSTFFVNIPYKPVNFDETSQKGNKQPEQTVLIAEDEEINFLYIDILINNFEQEIKTLHAKNGVEAVEMCKQRSEIKLVLMDIKMPLMNGYTATKLIKEFRPDLPIVVQTAYSTKADEDKAELAGCDAFLSKPIQENVLNELLAKYLIN